jgi:NAD(P)H-dependent FMN reductase
MKKILAFAGSNSKDSINYQLVTAIAAQVEGIETKVVKLTAYDIPMYSIDLENEEGIPVDVQLLKNEISKCQGLIVSVNEHNGSVSAFFKNVLDWLSRADRNYLEGKKLLIASTSPGERGAKTALEYAKMSMPRFGGEVVESFSFPSFQENFDTAKGVISNPTLQLGMAQVVASFVQEVNSVG